MYASDRVSFDNEVRKIEKARKSLNDLKGWVDVETVNREMDKAIEKLKWYFSWDNNPEKDEHAA